MQAAGRGPRDVGHREICVRVVHGRAPLDAAERAAFTRAVLPDDLAVLVGVEGPAYAGLLSDDDEIAPAGDGREDRRAAEIDVRTVRFRTIRICAASTSRDVDVGRRRLRRPLDRTALQ